MGNIEENRIRSKYPIGYGISYAILPVGVGHETITLYTRGFDVRGGGAPTGFPVGRGPVVVRAVR